MNDTKLYQLLRPILATYLKILFKPTIIGRENIPTTEGCILVSNHQSNYDFISMAIGTKRQVHFLAKHTLFKGILKPIMNGVGAIPVNRMIKDKNVLSMGKEILKRDLILGIFPEGTFNKTNHLIAPFKIGAVKLSYEMKKPIIPVVIIPPYKRKKLKIVIGKPIYILDSNLEKENERLMSLFVKVIQENRGV